MAYEIVVIGTSLGGLSALEELLSGLPAMFPTPIAVVQHRSVESGETLVDLLQQYSELHVCEPHDKEPILPGRVYLGPPDYHLLIDDGFFTLSTEGPVLCARPSIDLLFELAAEHCGSGTLGVLLTGASNDGTQGARRIKASHGYMLVEDPATAESPSMPRAAIVAGAADEVLPLTRIAERLNRLCVRSKSDGDF